MVLNTDVAQVLSAIEEESNLRLQAEREARMSLIHERAGDFLAALACEERLLSIRETLHLLTHQKEVKR